jgi:hypothetical protein
LRTKEQETRLILHEHDDDDEYIGYGLGDPRFIFRKGQEITLLKDVQKTPFSMRLWVSFSWDKRLGA